MSKVLLVDTGFSSQPIYLELCRLGHEVHVVGANPLDCLAKSSNHYWNIDYSDIDALKLLVESEKFEFIVPGCTDRSYSSCVRVSEGRFPGIESIDVDVSINNKSRFREIARGLGLLVPEVQDASQTNLRWPLIVKPVDSFSGKGITVIEKMDDEYLVHAIKAASNVSPKGEFLVEDFIIGSLYSHSAFLSEGLVVKDFIVQEDSTVNRFVVDTSKLLPRPSKKLRQSLRDSIEKLAAALKLKDGLIHTQFILAGDQSWLIEMTRRCPGDLYSQLIELSTGFPYVRSYIRPFLGETLTRIGGSANTRSVMRHTITVNKSQNYGSVKFKKPILIDHLISLSVVGDQLKPSPFSRVAIVFASADNEKDFNSLYIATLRHQLYEIQP